MLSPSKSLGVIALLLLVPQASFGEDTPSAEAEGFCPLWENTGYIEAHRTGYIGTNGAHFGIQNRFQIGLQPINFIYRAPNLNFKASLYEADKTAVSVQTGYYYLMNGASQAFLSPMYSSRLDNPDFAVQLLPLSLSASHTLSDWFKVHQTLTALHVASNGPIVSGTSLGYSLVGEMFTKEKHSILLHVAEVGFWDHDFAQLGISYCRRTSSTEFRIGYFYRIRQDSKQQTPLIGLGFYL